MASVIVFLIGLGLAAVSSVVALAFATRLKAVQRSDDLVEERVGRHRSRLVPYASIGTLPGEPYMHWLIGAAAAVTLMSLRPGAPQRFVVPLATASLGAICLHHAVKLVYRRPRPAVALARGKTEPAFPSGHTADATAALFTAAYLLAREGIMTTQLACCVAILLAVTTGVSRVALGWHWASDVVGGWLAGMAVAAFSAGLYEWLAR